MFDAIEQVRATSGGRTLTVGLGNGEHDDVKLLALCQLCTATVVTRGWVEVEVKVEGNGQGWRGAMWIWARPRSQCPCITMPVGVAAQALFISARGGRSSNSPQLTIAILARNVGCVSR